jgi:hypothetical protein
MRIIGTETFGLAADGGAGADHHITAVGSFLQPVDESITQRIIYSVSARVCEKRLIDDVVGASLRSDQRSERVDVNLRGVQKADGERHPCRLRVQRRE